MVSNLVRLWNMERTFLVFKAAAPEINDLDATFSRMTE